LSKQTNVTSTFPLAPILTIVFVVLKLTHVIDWSWWWVLAPLWITAALILVVLALVGVAATCLRK
jgi:fatty acid desaturase